MHKDYNKFVSAIENKKLVEIVFNSHEKGTIKRKCVPFDFAVSNKYRDGINRFHFYDLDSPDGSHNLSALPEQLISLEILSDSFEPGDFVKWSPHWTIPRNWGIYS